MHEAHQVIQPNPLITGTVVTWKLDQVTYKQTETILGELGQYYGCWCPGFLGQQVTSSHGIASVK